MQKDEARARGSSQGELRQLSKAQGREKERTREDKRRGIGTQ